MKNNCIERRPFNNGLKKILLYMRITSFLLFMALMQLSASKSYSQTTVSLTIEKEIGLADIFKQIEQQTEYLFNYRDADIRTTYRKEHAPWKHCHLSSNR